MSFAFLFCFCVLTGRFCQVHTSRADNVIHYIVNEKLNYQLENQTFAIAGFLKVRNCCYSMFYIILKYISMFFVTVVND